MRENNRKLDNKALDDWSWWTVNLLMSYQLLSLTLGRTQVKSNSVEDLSLWAVNFLMSCQLMSSTLGRTQIKKNLVEDFIDEPSTDIFNLRTNTNQEEFIWRFELTSCYLFNKLSTDVFNLGRTEVNKNSVEDLSWRPINLLTSRLLMSLTMSGPNTIFILDLSFPIL